MSDLGVVGLLLLLLVLVLVYASLRVVQPYQVMVVFRLGEARADWVRGPGLQFLIPIIWRGVAVDMREQSMEVPSETAITKDDAPIRIGFLIYWQIVDALKSVVSVAYFAGALQGVAMTTLRAVISDILLDQALSKRDEITEVVRTRLDEFSARWGGRIVGFEIREITPQDDLAGNANRQLGGGRTPDEILADVARRSRSTPGAGQ